MSPGTVILCFLLGAPVEESAGDYPETSGVEAAHTKVKTRAPWTFVPTVAVEVGTFTEALRVNRGESALSSETRALWLTRLMLGLRFDLPNTHIGIGSLRGQTSVGLGPIYARGHWPLHLRQEMVWGHAVLSWLSLQVGATIGLHLNLSDIRFSFLEIGPQVGVEVADLVEIAYLPAYAVGLGSRRKNVFGGEVMQEVDTGLKPLSLMLRIRFDGLSF
jgi:hypothetical protein